MSTESEDESRLPGPPYCTKNGKAECTLRQYHAGGCKPVYCAKSLSFAGEWFFCDRPPGHNGRCDSDAAVDARTAREKARAEIAQSPGIQGTFSVPAAALPPGGVELGLSQPLDIACAFLDGVKTTLREKNKAYGDSALRPLRCFSRADAVEQIKVRIDDKLSRIARGAGIDAMDEDVIRDLVGYLALFYEARQIGKGDAK